MRTTLLSLTLCLLMHQSASAVKVADITRLSGQRSSLLTGMGLVYGLPGTGDGGDFAAAIRPMVSMLSKFANPTTARELSNVQNVALVMLTVTIPPNGVRDGDRLDVYLTSIGAASSLKGGRLFVTPLLGPLANSGIFALAEGQLTLEDLATPTTAVVKGGCVMETDLKPENIVNGRILLIIEDPAASWTTSSTIAKIINDAESTTGETLAIARDAKTVEVTIPSIERERPDSFISRVQRLPVPLLPTEARVQINQRTGTIILTGDVEVSPVVISHKGLTITTIQPTPTPSPRTPVVNSKSVLTLDTTNQGGAKLQDLADAFDRIKLPAEDRIIIVKELHKTGKLHAKLVVE